MEPIGIHICEGREKKGRKTQDVTESHFWAEINYQRRVLKIN